jgi:hypothetical protein
MQRNPPCTTFSAYLIAPSTRLYEHVVHAELQRILQHSQSLRWVDDEDNNVHPNGHIEERFVKRAGTIVGVDKRDVFAGLLEMGYYSRGRLEEE